VKKNIKIEKFEQKCSFVKESYHGGQYIGLDCEMVLSKLDDLDEVAKEENPSCIAFVDSLRDLKEVYGMAHKNDVVENHRDCKKLEETVMKLHRDFKVIMTLEQHFIFEHLPEYLELTGKTQSKKL